MSSEPPIVQLRLCPQCGAACQVNQSGCWMCSGPLPVAMPGRTAISGSRASSLDAVFFVLLAICVGLTVLVGIGIAVEDPGALVGLAIIVGPAYAVTGVRALWQIQETGRAQPAKLFMSFVVSFVFTLAVVALLAIAGIVLLFVICLQAMSGQ